MINGLSSELIPIDLGLERSTGPGPQQEKHAVINSTTEVNRSVSCALTSRTLITRVGIKRESYFKLLIKSNLAESV